MFFNTANRSELHYLYYINKAFTSNDINMLSKAFISLVTMKANNTALKNVIELLNCRQFDDTIKCASRSQALLESRSVNSQQDDLIYNYILFVLSNGGISNE